ncbi:alpha/beta fold hydrolase [Microbacterium sp. 18062]|uniref:alpha/beta fold hydrolase n=1 Tax=Microbacterium sp. 18062 TaxID=2681410 RepID=UPI00190F9DCF|nr:alpha/beta hydrolase [Microbacterium sp. 18062]
MSGGGDSAGGRDSGAGRAVADAASDAVSPAGAAASLPVVVLLHGAWASNWVWDPIMPALRGRGYDVIAVRLPDAAEPESASTLAENVARVETAIGGRAGRIHLVGHSGGGIVATAAGEALSERVVSVTYVAGIMLPSGVAFDDVRAELGDAPGIMGLAPFVEEVRDGSATVVPVDAAVAVLFQAAPPALAVEAARRLQPQWNVGLDLVPTWTPDRWGALSRLYVEASEDRDIPLALQRHMQGRTPGAEVVTLDSDHAPQLSAPEALVAALSAFIDRH